jgi:hypothetical protein
VNSFSREWFTFNPANRKSGSVQTSLVLPLLAAQSTGPVQRYILE